MTDTTLPTVYEALNDAIASVGFVGADGTNQHQGFAFRSIDGVVGAVRAPLNAAGLSLIPSFKSIDQIDYTRADGKITHRAILEGSFRVVGPAGDSFEFTTIGEAMDTEGRASNKAMSAATKNALIRLLQIGAGDDGDGADTYHAPAAAAPRAAAPQAAPQAGLAGRVAGAAPAAQAPRADNGELLSQGQSKNLYRLWKHVLGWDKETYLQQVELVTGTYVSDDRNITKSQASDLIRALKVLGGEPVDDAPVVPSAPAAPSGEGEYVYQDEDF